METRIELPCFGITVLLNATHETSDRPSGRIMSDLHNDEDVADDYESAINGIESLILAHACAGIDIASPAYVEGIETAVIACENFCL